VARGLRTVAARGHAAPAPATGRRGIVEDPSAAIVRAHPEPVRTTVRDLAHDGLRDPRERIVDRVALVAVGDLDTVVGRLQSDELLRPEESVDRVDRAVRRATSLCDGVADRTQGRTNVADPRETRCVVRGMRGNGVPGREVVIDEPGECSGRAVEMVDGRTVLELERVDEVECDLERDAMVVWLNVHANHYIAVDRLRASGYSTRVTDNHADIGYQERGASRMENLIVFIAAAVSVLGVVVGASLMWGADSRPAIGDDHRR
jgi:hypothetical protein